MINFSSHQLRAGQSGAAEDFEQMLALLVRVNSGEANMIFANPGDWGIDVLIGDLHGRVTVWQAKYFVRGVGRSQQAQIKSSFRSAVKAAADQGYVLERWVLCIPSSMDGPTMQWWQTWKAGQERDTGVALDLWDETVLRELLLRPGAGDVRRHFYNSYRFDSSVAHGDSPYKGLKAFEEDDAKWFFGRDAAAEQVMALLSAALGSAGIVVVSGISGAGKSSLLRAGVIAKIRENGLPGVPEAAFWPALVFTPGSKPLEELAVQVAPLARVDASTVRDRLSEDPSSFSLTARQATAAIRGYQGSAGRTVSGQRRLLVVVDQCEQLFTLCNSQAERRAFIAALHAAASGESSGALVVLSIRADFEALLANYPELGEAVQGRYLLTAMTERQLRLAITQPAILAGCPIDGELVHVLLEETRNYKSKLHSPGSSSATNPGILPLLSYALDQAWRGRSGLTVTLADYERAGGIEGAIEAAASRAYGQLTPAQREITRQIFTRLTTVDVDGLDTSVPVARTELIQMDVPDKVRDVTEVLEQFADERLISLNSDTVEISHESLLTAWPQLREWLTETHADRIVRANLHSTAQDWERSGRDPAYLYQGSRLEAGEYTAARIGADARHTPLSRVENDFLKASRRAGRRRARIRRQFTGLLLALAVGLAAAWIIAANAAREARVQRDNAISGQLVSESENSSTTDATTSEMESIAAWGLSRTPQARHAMLVDAASLQTATITADTGRILAVTFSANSKVLAAESDGGVQLWNAITGQPIGKPLQVAGAARIADHQNMAFSPDGKTIAIGGAAGTSLWDVTTGRQLGKSLGGHQQIFAVAFSPNGKMLFTIDKDANMRTWQVATSRQVGADRNFGTSDPLSVAFSPGARTIAVVGPHGDRIQLRDIVTGRQIGKTLITGDPSTGAIFSPNGKTVAAYGEYGLDLFDVSAGKRIGKRIPAIGDSLAFSPDGNTLATVDGTLRLWNSATGQQVGAKLSDGTKGLNAVAFRPDGRTIATGGEDGEVRLWNPAEDTFRQSMLPRDDGVGPITWAGFSPDGRTLATHGIGGEGVLWDMATGQPVSGPISSELHQSIAVAFSPDGKMLAAANVKSGVRLWNLATGGESRQPIATGMSTTISLAFSPDGKILATIGSDGTVRRWDVATGRETGRAFCVPHRGALWAVFGPDGKTLITSDDSSATARLWDLDTGKEVGTPIAAWTATSNWAVFSPDGKTLATIGMDGELLLWDVATSRRIGSPLSVSGGVNALAFSPDGKILAAAGNDGALLLWDVAARQKIGSPLSVSGGVNALAFSPDGKTLVATQETTMAMWDVSYLANPLKRLCSQIGGSFKSADWEKYVPPGPSYRNSCP